MSRGSSIAQRLKKPWVALGLIYAVSALVRLRAIDCFVRPFIFNDELWHLRYAESVFGWEGLHWGPYLVPHPNWLYPMFLAPFLAWGEFRDAYDAMLVGNTLLMSLSVPLTYGLAREVCSPPRALAAAGLTALLTCMGYNAALMAENLFMPASILALWMAWRAMESPTIGRRLVAGALLGLLYHIKPHGLFYPLAFGMAVILAQLFASTRTEQGSPGRAVARAIVRHLPTALACLAVLSVRFLEAWLIEGLDGPFSVQAFLGAYYTRARGHQPFDTRTFFVMLAGNAALWMLAAGIAPAWALFGRLGGLRRAKPDGKLDRLAVLAAVTSAVLILFTARHTIIADPTWSLYERYLMSVFPLMIVTLCAEAPPDNAAVRGGFTTWVWRSVSLVFMASVLGYVCVQRAWVLQANMPSLGGYLLVVERAMAPASFWIIPISMAIVFVIGWRRLAPGFARRAWAIGTLLVFLNLGWYASSEIVLEPAAQYNNSIAKKIGRNVPEKDNLLILRDGIEYLAAQSIEFYTRGQTVYLSDVNRDWFDLPLDLAPNGEVLSQSDPKATWLVAESVWRMNKPPERRWGNFYLYKLSGETDLAMDLEQVMPVIEARSQPAPALATGSLFPEGFALALKFIEQPARWVAGQAHEVRLVIKNVGAGAINSRFDRHGIGYHWSNFEITQSWKAIVWDDGNHVFFPETVQPDETFELTLTVRAPEPAGPGWVLGFDPFVASGPFKEWGGAGRTETITVELED